jgi:hypothetical protein
MAAAAPNGALRQMYPAAALTSAARFGLHAFRPSRKAAIVRAFKGHSGDSRDAAVAHRQNEKDRNIKWRFAWNKF